MIKYHPRIAIDRLREIGWSKWDPIGILATEGSWKDQPFEDEYDTYLVKAAEMLKSGSKPSEIVDYLYSIATEYMGLGLPKDIAVERARLMIVVNTICEDPLIWLNAEK